MPFSQIKKEKTKITKCQNCSPQKTVLWLLEFPECVKKESESCLHHNWPMAWKCRWDLLPVYPSNCSEELLRDLWGQGSGKIILWCFKMQILAGDIQMLIYWQWVGGGFRNLKWKFLLTQIYTMSIDLSTFGWLDLLLKQVTMNITLNRNKIF